MAKNSSTKFPPVPDWFRAEYQSKYAPVPVDPKFMKAYEKLNDTECAELFRSIVRHTVSHDAQRPQNLDEFFLDSVFEELDIYLDMGLQSKWYAKCRGDKGKEAAEGKEGQAPLKDTLSPPNNNDNNNSNVNVNENVNTNPNAQARGGGSEGSDCVEIDLSKYLTPEEEERLFEGVANYDIDFLKRFVLSPYFNPADTLYYKTENAKKFKNEEDAKAAAEKEAAELARREEEKAARLAGYPRISAGALTAQTLAQYLEDTGRVVDPEEAAKIYQSIKTAELRGGVSDWRAYARKCADKVEPQAPTYQTAPRGSGQDW